MAYRKLQPQPKSKKCNYQTKDITKYEPACLKGHIIHDLKSGDLFVKL